MTCYFKSEDQLLERAESLIGKKISELDIYNRYSKKTGSKGIFGQVLEEGGFYKNLDSSRSKDFNNLNIELKSTGYIWVFNNTKVSAKERLVLSIIDFDNEYKRCFFRSDAYNQLHHMLLIFYEYRADVPEKNFVITNYYNYRFENIPEKDQKIIKADWEKIQGKIKKGQAHLLSEGDTLYLGACPKGSSAKSLRNQPFNEELAMQRAYSLKTTYMTGLLRSEVFKDTKNREEFIKDIDELNEKDMSDIIIEKFDEFRNKNTVEVEKILGIENTINRSAKHYLYNLTSAMAGVKDINSTEEFQKANIRIKIIRLMDNGKLKEHMSFPFFEFKDIVDKTWQESDIYNTLESRKFLFALYKVVDESANKYRFDKVMLWNMPVEDINNFVKPVYKNLQEVLNKKLILTPRGNVLLNNLPKARDFPVCHIRPHARDAMDVAKLPSQTQLVIAPDPRDENVAKRANFYKQTHSYVKQCFWLHKDYLLKIINEK